MVLMDIPGDEIKICKVHGYLLRKHEKTCNVVGNIINCTHALYLVSCHIETDLGFLSLGDVKLQLKILFCITV